jgi:hypothetical protein
MDRHGLSERPAKMRGLKVDERGYPVPWFVAEIDGKPDFRVMNPVRFVKAISQNLCWICGNLMGTQKTFVAGPMCGINRTSAEPPCHLECARYAAINCPFLNNPNALRREDDFTRNTLETLGGISIPRNPGVVMLWQTRTCFPFDDGNGKPLICMGEPFNVEWYRESRLATREEVIESVESGFPALAAIARTEPGAMQDLLDARKQFEKYLPAATSPSH